LHYVSNVDAWSLATTLAPLQASRTLFVVQSKSFTTQETMTLFASARRWLIDAGCPQAELHLHLAAVTAKPALAQSQGISDESCFSVGDWVGGRYSLWSAIGLPLVAAIGREAYLQMLQTWDTFGKGWERRVKEVNAKGLTLSQKILTAAV
jgi:glucose-6-phosphate isomerase